MIELLHIDCMDYMATLPDKAFDLAIVDPPYGIGERLRGGTTGEANFNDALRWDIAPDDTYFSELFRVSVKQIVWGSNHFSLPPSRGFVVWDKKQPETCSFSMAELAWTSFDRCSLIYRQFSSHVTQGKRIHPTQKPVKLYQWLLTNYAKPGQRILDTHLGSGSRMRWPGLA